MRAKWLFLAVLAMLIAVPALAQQPENTGRRDRANRDNRPAMAAQVPEEMLNRLGATDAEKAAIRSFATAKAELARDYQQTLRTNFQLLRDEKTTADQFTKALADSYAAKAKYTAAVAKAETDLKAKLTPKIQLALLATGVLDNGLGMGGGRRYGGMPPVGAPNLPAPAAPVPPPANP